MGKSALKTEAVDVVVAGQDFVSGEIPSVGRAFETVSADIRSRIADGLLKPGDKLQSERELAKHFAVSRNAVREALRSLEASGVLRFQKGSTGGAFVRDNNASALMLTVRDGIFLGNISYESITDVRSLLLTHAVELACEKADDSDFAALEMNLELTARLAEIGDREPLVQAIGEFYRVLGRASKNEMLGILLDAVTGMMMRLLIELNVSYAEQLLPDRRQLVDLLRSRDAERVKKALSDSLAYLHDFVLRAVADQLPNHAR